MLRYLRDVRRFDHLEHELGDPVTPSREKWLVNEIEKQDFDLASIIFIDDAGADIDALLYRLTASLCDAPVPTGRHLDRNTGRYELSSTGFDARLLVVAIQVVTRRFDASSGRHPRRLRESSHEQMRRLTRAGGHFYLYHHVNPTL